MTVMTRPLSLMTLDELVQALMSREVSSVELVESSLSQIERHDSTLNAVVALRAEQALAEARVADRLASDERGPLHGIPVLIKDLNETIDLPTTYGSAALGGNLAEAEALTVTRLRRAGAIVVGKTNTPEFGLRPTTDSYLFGPTRNPFSTAHTSGGSSGGAAAALASGMAPIALGGDGGGSCRIPASCCGVVGFKPSRGLVPWVPSMQECWSGLGTNGPMARSVADAERMLQVIAGRVVGEPYGVAIPSASAAEGGRRLRIGVTTSPTHGSVDPEVVRAVESTARLLEELGCDVETVDLDYSGLLETWMVAVEAATAMTVDEVVGDTGLAKLEANTLALASRGWARSAADHARAVSTMRTLSGQVMAATDHLDIVLTPTLTAPAPVIPDDPDHQSHEDRWREYTDWLAFTYPTNCTGQPAISLPGGHTEQGLPIGVQLIGRNGDDAGVLHVAQQLESARPWRDTYNRFGE